jgi:hypothetical protein
MAAANRTAEAICLERPTVVVVQILVTISHIIAQPIHGSLS